MTVISPPAGPSWARRHPIWTSIIALVAILAIVFTTLWLANAGPWSGKKSLVSDTALQRPADVPPTTTAATPTPSASTPDPSDSATPTPSDSASPANAAAAVDKDGCLVTFPATKSYTLTATLRFAAGNTTALDEITNLAGSGYTGFVYGGAGASATDYTTWIQTNACHGFTSNIDVTSLFTENSISNNQIRDLVKTIDGTDHLVGYTVSLVDSEGDDAKANYLERIRLMKQYTQKPVTGNLELFSSDVNVAAIVTQKYTVTGAHAIVYLGMSQWGSVDKYPTVAKVAKKVDGGNATVFVQAYDAGQGQPTPAQVAAFTKAVHDQGVHNVGNYTEEDTEGSADNVGDYLHKCAELQVPVLSK